MSKAFAVASLVFLMTLTSSAQDVNVSAIAPDQLVAIGRQLRTEIEAALQRRNTAASERFDISEVVYKYISVGESFESASRKLLAAGFHLAARPIPVANRIGGIDPYSIVAGATLSESFASRTGVQIFVLPEFPGELENRVRSVDAVIYHRSL